MKMYTCVGNFNKWNKMLTEHELRRLYQEELLTDSEIAERFGTYQVKISRLRKRWGIQTLDKTGRIEASLPVLTQHQKELIMGSLLGDGWMNATSEKAARFCETHSENQKEYLHWKAALLEPFTSSLYPTEKRKDGSIYHGWGMSTQSCAQLREFYDLFYPSGERAFPTELVVMLTPFVLAVWYMDDGSLTSKYHPQITFGLDEDSLNHALSGLRNLGFSPTISENSDGTTTIQFPGQDVQFLEMVGPHIPDCMKYKIPDYSVRKIQYERGRKLTPDTARTLYDGGMSCRAISELYGVSPSTVHRRLHKEGFPSRMGRPRRSYSHQAAKVSLENYETSQWKKLSGPEQEEWVESIYRVLAKTPFPYPLPLDDVRERFQKLRDKEVYLTESGEIRPMTLFGVRLCDSYFPNRFKARYRDQISAVEAWHNAKFLRRAVQIQLKAGDPVIPRRVRKAIQYQVRTPTIFRPGAAKYIYQTYASAGQATWDPCSGYGGRMLGALASDLYYIGTDVEEETCLGNKALATALGKEDRVELHCVPAESFTVPRTVDLVFTSPPYFDREKYSDRPTQSWRQNDTAKGWLENFLRPILTEAFRALRKGGTLCININDLRDRRGNVIPLVQPTRDIAESVGFVYSETLKMPLSNLSPRDYEPILVFRCP